MVYKDYAEIVVNELQVLLSQVSNEKVQEVVDEILKAKTVFFVGVGRVKIALESMAKRLNHLGINTVVVGQITEPPISSSDLLIVGSNSGESFFPLGVANKAKVYGAKVVHIGSNNESSMKSYTDLMLVIPTASKVSSSNTDVVSIQPMTTLFEQTLFLLGDIIALMIIKEKNIDVTQLWKCHANLE